MATPHKLLVIHSEQRVVGAQELRVEDNLYTVLARVEKLDLANLVQDGVLVIVGHVVGNDRGEGIALQCENAALEEDVVLFGHDVRRVRDLTPVQDVQ